ncbi:MAG: hypothetical protein GWN64_07890 [Candidatus Thorarchaeota archaeon]|nr:hypothetical protein [Candidatus Thorarchaeota archaeon]
MEVNFKFVPKIYDFFNNNPGKEIYIIAGGRSKGATWGIADRLIVRSLSGPGFGVCTREIKGTVDHSSRRTIESRITAHGLKDLFDFQNTLTRCKRTGYTFIYTGLSKLTEDNFQGLEGVTDAWLGEAHTMELTTYQKFEPTIRDNDAVVYIDYNTQFSNTPIHMLFTEDPVTYPFNGRKDLPELAYLFMDYRDNIFCPEKIKRTAERNKTQYSKSDWEWIWLGKLKDATERYVVNELDVRAAMHREIPYEEVQALPRVVGCDIAHLGGDEIVFYQRRGGKFLDEGYHTTKNTFNVTCDELEAYIGFDKGSIIVIDNGHIGCAVADEMEHRGYYVERVNFGGTDMRFDPEHCKDCATDMAFNFANELPKLQLPYDELLCNQLSQRKWDFVNNKGIRKIESKDDFKKHAVHLEGHTSPDRGDAMWLALYNRSDVRIPMGMSNMIRTWN